MTLRQRHVGLMVRGLPLPPFTAESARQKVRLAEDAWNSHDPARVSQAYTPDSRWRNHAESIDGRASERHDGDRHDSPADAEELQTLP